jgi:hypothetical protein
VKTGPLLAAFVFLVVELGVLTLAVVGKPHLAPRETKPAIAPR